MGGQRPRIVALSTIPSGHASMFPNALTADNVIVTCTGDNVDVSAMSEAWVWFKRFQNGKKKQRDLDGAWRWAELTDNKSEFSTFRSLFNGS